MHVQYRPVNSTLGADGPRSAASALDGPQRTPYGPDGPRWPRRPPTAPDGPFSKKVRKSDILKFFIFFTIK
jgi:hypothetical protein